MAENPLLPNAELRALLAQTRRCAVLDAATQRKLSKETPRGSKPAPPGSREALLAATTIQLKPGDLLIPEPGDSTAAALAPRRTHDLPPALISSPIPDLGRNAPRLLLAAAMAAGLRASGADGVVTAFTRAGAPETGWAQALQWAQQRLLPLVLVCAEPSGSAAFRSTNSPATRSASSAKAEDRFTWDNVERAAKRLQLPILCADGEDAVAVYRIMQESALRARSGAGPAVLWTMLPTPRELRAGRPLSARPVRRLEHYLRARKIPA